MGDVIVHTIDILNGFEVLSEKPFSSDSFALDVLQICGAAKATLKKLKDGTSNKADGLLGDSLLQKKLYFRPSAKGQTGADLSSLAVDPLTKKYKPRLLITCDGDEVSVLDTKKGTPTHFAWKDLPKHYDLFWPLAGHEVYEGHEETKADRDAAYALSKLYDAIIDQNPDWDDEARQHDLNLLMTRLLFCMFAEDTGIFEDHLFTRYIADYTDASGGNINKYLEMLFDHLNTADCARKNVPDWLNGFHYVNGGLFRDKVDIPYFSKRARRYLIDAAELDWADINPDIFGTMIQAVVTPEMRGDLGMHYTSVENIMKVIHPLFLMSLEREFEKAKISPRKLEDLLVRLSKIRVFDPACGSGNFLIVAYQKLRELEMQVFQQLEKLSGNRTMGFSRISLDNFFGIEIADFAAETAKLSLWVAEYQMNQKFRVTFGDAPPDLPLRDGGQIITDNALRADWLAACPPSGDEAVETYICGNPPYLGSKKGGQSKKQKADLASVFEPYTSKFKNLDYVTAWYMKAAEYNLSSPMEAALVATNSICQGEQVSLLWPLIFAKGLEIKFAHRAFEWSNHAKNKAGITCVIVGVSAKRKYVKKHIFEKGTKRTVRNIGPYLIDMDNLVVAPSRLPINNLPKMFFGNMPNDNGALLLDVNEARKILAKHPSLKPFVRRIYGSKEFTGGIVRYCLWLRDEDIPQVKNMEEVRLRIEKCYKHRDESSRPTTKKLAAFPHRFGEIRFDKYEHLFVIPSVTTKVRRYFPVGLITDGSMISNLAFALCDQPIHILGLLGSKMHTVWIRNVCGGMRSHYRYSNTLGYNTFPVPELSETDTKILTDLSWQIIEAREQHSTITMDKLYNPTTMPENLLAAHQAFDHALEQIYIGRNFISDTERLEHLFKLYTKMTKRKAA